MAEGETIEGEVGPVRRFQARVVGEKEWNDHYFPSLKSVVIAESINANMYKTVSEIRPFVVEVRDPELPHDVSTLDVVCALQFMILLRKQSERN